MAAESTWDGVSPRVLRTHGAQDEGVGRERESDGDVFRSYSGEVNVCRTARTTINRGVMLDAWLYSRPDFILQTPT